MPIKLEVKTGPVSGRVIPLADGKVVTIGRTERANVAIPEDTFLSGVHFAVENRGPEWRVVDRKSANGTYVNGAKVAEAVLREGDEIFAGKSTFKVTLAEVRLSAPAEAPPAPTQTRAPAPKPSAPAPPVAPKAVAAPKAAPPAEPVRAPASAAASSRPDAVAPLRPGPQIGCWSFDAVPGGWEVVDGFGIRRREAGFFPSDVTASEEALKPGTTFEQYVESQLDLVRLLVSSPQIDAGWPARIQGVEEIKAFLVRYRTDDGRSFVQRQVYVRKGQRVGSLTLTTLENESARLEPLFDQIISGLKFDP